MKKIFALIPLLLSQLTFAQSYTLQQLIDSALVNNQLLQIKDFQIKEKNAGFKEMNLLRLPNLTLMGSYMYQFAPLRITMDEGALGSVTAAGQTIPLPWQSINQRIGNYHNAFAGAVLYQPLTEQFKIANGANVKKIELRIIETEKQQAAHKVKHGIEQLYLAINATRWALKAQDAKVELAQEELNYIETAIESEKAIPVNYYGLKAALADERQQRLKKEMEVLNLLNKLNQLTGLDLSADQISEVPAIVGTEKPLQEYIQMAQNSPDYQLAALNQQKAMEGIRASKNSYLPDVGIIGGYIYQYGMDYINSNFAMLGVNLKWSINDIFKNKQEQNQREALNQQAILFKEHTQKDIEQTITTAYNELMVSKNLMVVVEEVLQYREQNYQLHQERYEAGLINKKELIKAKQEYTKAHSDFYAAQLGYQIQLSKLLELTGE